MKRLVLGLLILVLAGVSTACCAQVRVRVGLFRTHVVKSLSIECEASCLVKEGGASVCVLQAGESARCEVSGKRLLIRWGSKNEKSVGALTVHSSNKAPITVKACGASITCAGLIRLGVVDGAMLIVNEVDLEDYVRGVLPNEMSSSWPLEALKAQAVAIRTLGVSRAGEHESEGFDLCDTTHCQVYRGAGSETDETNAAVSATAGEILVYDDKPVAAYYCSTCGGKTSDSFGSKHIASAPYLNVKQDLINGTCACEKSPHCKWRTTVKNQELLTALRADKRTDPGRKLLRIEVVDRDESGRASVVEIKGERTIEVDGYVFWNVVCRGIGWGRVKSTQFTVKPAADGFEFSGRGLGHGVGMCQWGARRRAELGWDYQKILGFYYPGAGIRQAAP